MTDDHAGATPTTTTPVWTAESADAVAAHLRAAHGVRGVGIDAEPVSRWEDPDLRLFTDEERRHCRSVGHPAEAFAGRWCAKEAVVKAVWPFVRLTLRDVEIVAEADGRPTVRLAPRLGTDIAVSVSITHTDGLALAIAVVTDS